MAVTFSLVGKLRVPGFGMVNLENPLRMRFHYRDNGKHVDMYVWSSDDQDSKHILLTRRTADILVDDLIMPALVSSAGGSKDQSEFSFLDEMIKHNLTSSLSQFATGVELPFTPAARFLSVDPVEEKFQSLFKDEEILPYSELLGLIRDYFELREEYAYNHSDGEAIKLLRACGARLKRAATNGLEFANLPTKGVHGEY